MYKNDVYSHFGGCNAVARALGIEPGSVSGWGSIIPKGRAYEIQVLTLGKLKVDPTLYDVTQTLSDIPA